MTANVPITVIVVSPPRGRGQCDFRMPPQSDDSFELIDSDGLMREMSLADSDFNPATGVAANFAGATARGEVLAFVRADVAPAGDWVAAIRRFFAEQPQAQAVIGQTQIIGDAHPGDSKGVDGPVFQIAVRASAFKAAGGFDILRPPDADAMGLFRERLVAVGIAVAFDGRIVTRAVPALLEWHGIAARVTRRLTDWLRGGWYEYFNSPLLVPVNPLLIAADDSRSPAASIIMPIKPSHRCALLALHALARQDIDEPYEIIVCIEEGTELEKDIARVLPKVRFAACEPKAGPGGGRNAGIDGARGEVLAFTDADCLVERTWLRGLVEAVRSRDGGLVRGWRQMYHVWSPVARAVQFTEEGTARPMDPRIVPTVSGANMAVSRQLLEAHHARFAPRVYGAEEVALLSELPPDKRAVLLDPSVLVLEMRYEDRQGALQRMTSLGRGSGHLRRTRKMRGSFLARQSWLSILLLPAKLLMIARRLGGCGWRAVADYLRLTPVISYLLLYYLKGFREGAADPKTVSASGKDVS